MDKRDILLRMNLLVNYISSQGRSWDDIARFLDDESQFRSYDLTISKRQFQRDIHRIYNIFKVSIIYNKRKDKYEIDRSDTISAIEALDTLSILNLSDNRYGGVIFELRRPTGGENIPKTLFAIKNELVIYFTYQKFYENYNEKRTILPYVVKESNRRWYILGLDLEKNELRVFAMDRVSDLEIGKKLNRPTDISEIEKLFTNCFGIILPKKHQKVEEIILSYSGFQGQYLKTMPLHHSQLILSEEDNKIEFKLNLYITYDFIMEILSSGSQVKVIAPESLNNIIREEHLKALSTL
ncbi:WYL domain-containing protein [Sphingobacterium sp. HJSM2_6]|uniref:WYL domain-containing protein n=1 Tax=Sphingobacterium sp. HJSM2_6 TaxID=3366264 RepID=UPI003BC5227A